MRLRLEVIIVVLSGMGGGGNRCGWMVVVRWVVAIDISGCDSVDGGGTHLVTAINDNDVAVVVMVNIVVVVTMVIMVVVVVVVMVWWWQLTSVDGCDSIDAGGTHLVAAINSHRHRRHGG